MNFFSMAQTANKENKKKLLDLLEENKSAIILDCGYSEKSLTTEVLNKTKAKKMCGLDINQSAPLSFRIKNKDANTVRCDLNKSLPFKNESFDTIISIGSGNYYTFLVFGLQPYVIDVSKAIYCGNKLNPKNLQKSWGISIFLPCALKELLEYHGFLIEKLRREK